MVKEGYITIQQNRSNYFKERLIELSNKSCSIYNPNEFTKQNAIEVCQAYNKNVKENKPQPKSKDQIKMDLEHQVKLTEINNAKKLKTNPSQDTLENHENKTS